MSARAALSGVLTCAALVRERYVLQVRFRYYRERIGPDKVKDSGWLFLDSAYSKLELSISYDCLLSAECRDISRGLTLSRR